jgi:hypothetical protein
MTLEKTLRQQLSKSEPGGFHVHAGGWDITVTADKTDSLSCALNELALERNTLINEDVRAWATRIADSATGLLEPLRLLEADQSVGKAVLRSETPTVDVGKAFYYELQLTRTDRTSAKLRRYAGDRSGADKREAVPFVLTHDAIVKLVNDIAGES